MTFEDLFRLVAEHDGEIRLSFVRPDPWERTLGGDVKRLQIRASLGYDPMGRKRSAVQMERLFATRDLRPGPGGRETAYLRDCLYEVTGALKDQLASPAEMLTQLAAGLQKQRDVGPSL